MATEKLKTLNDIASASKIRIKRRIAEDRDYIKHHKHQLSISDKKEKILNSYLSNGATIQAIVWGIRLMEEIKKEHPSWIKIDREKKKKTKRHTEISNKLYEFINDNITMSKHKSLAEIAKSIKEKTLETILPERKLMEELKADNSITTETEKNSIIDLYTNHGWHLESAISNELENKYYKEEKIKLVKELFPDYDTQK